MRMDTSCEQCAPKRAFRNVCAEANERIRDTGETCVIGVTDVVIENRADRNLCETFANLSQLANVV